jgi:hypothetical protein
MDVTTGISSGILRIENCFCYRSEWTTRSRFPLAI